MRVYDGDIYKGKAKAFRANKQQIINLMERVKDYNLKGWYLGMNGYHNYWVVEDGIKYTYTTLNELHI